MARVSKDRVQFLLLNFWAGAVVMFFTCDKHLIYRIVKGIRPWIVCIFT